MKYATEKFLNKNNEIKNGVGENVLGKTTKSIGEGLGILGDIRFFSFIVCNSPILLFCCNDPLIPPH